MSIEDQDSVDVIGVNESGIVVLTISDHLKWDDDHLYLLQEKINTYLAISVQFTKKVSRKGKSTWQPTVGTSWLPASQTASQFLEEAHNKIASKPKTHGTIQGQMSSVSVDFACFICFHDSPR